jgi:hypothetical protein
LTFVTVQLIAFLILCDRSFDYFSHPFVTARFRAESRGKSRAKGRTAYYIFTPAFPHSLPVVAQPTAESIHNTEW